MFQRYDKFVTGLNRVNNAFVVFSLAAMFIMLMLQIISHFLVYIPMPWGQDMIIFFMMCVIFFGSGSATQADKHIRIEFLVFYCGEKAARVLLIVADCLSVVFLGILCYQTAVLGVNGLHTKTGASPLPLGIYYWVIGFGSLVMALNFIDLICKRIKRIPIKAAEEKEEKE